MGRKLYPFRSWSIGGNDHDSQTGEDLGVLVADVRAVLLGASLGTKRTKLVFVEHPMKARFIGVVGG